MLGTREGHERLPAQRQDAAPAPDRDSRAHHRLPQDAHLAGRRDQAHPRAGQHHARLTARDDAAGDTRMAVGSPCIRARRTRARGAGIQESISERATDVRMGRSVCAIAEGC